MLQVGPPTVTSGSRSLNIKLLFLNWVNTGTEGGDVQAGVNSSLADVSSTILIYSSEATIRNSKSFLHQELHKRIYSIILIRERKIHNSKLRLFKGISEVLTNFYEKINENIEHVS